MTLPTFDHDSHVAAVAQGDHHAFVALYRQEAPRMLTLGQKMLGRRSEAQDAVRDTFILVWKHAESCDTDCGLARAWIYSIFRHRVMDSLRRPGRLAPGSIPWTDHLPDATVPDDRAAPLLRTVRELPAAQRRPLLLTYYHGATDRQIAASLASTSSEVQRQIQQALGTIGRRHLT